MRLRTALGLLALLELVVFVLIASWIGVGWTILAMLGTSALGALLLRRQGTRALGELRERMEDPAAPRHSHARGGPLQRGRRPAGRELGNAGLVAIGGLLMLLPGFVGDLIGLLCLLPGTRDVVRAVVARTAFSRLPHRMRGPVRVRSARVEEVEVQEAEVQEVEVQEVWRPGPRPDGPPRVIEGEVAPHSGATAG